MASDRFTIGSRTVAAGSFTIGPTQVAASRSRIVASLDATQHLNSGVTLTLLLEISYDGGSTWRFVTSTSRQGGIAFGDEGEVVNTMDFSLALNPEEGNRRRQVRVSAELTGGSFVTAGGFVEAID